LTFRTQRPGQHHRGLCRRRQYSLRHDAPLEFLVQAIGIPMFVSVSLRSIAMNPPTWRTRHGIAEVRFRLIERASAQQTSARSLGSPSARPRNAQLAAATLLADDGRHSGIARNF
jgi:hypothetical protein